MFENCWLPPADGGLVAGSGVGGETVSPGAQWSAAIPPTICSSGGTTCSLWRRIFCWIILGPLEVVWPPAEWTSVVLWSLLQLEAGSGHADKIVSAVRDD